MQKASCQNNFEKENNNDETSDNATYIDPRVEDCPPGLGGQKDQELHSTKRGIRLPFSPEAWSKAPESPKKKTSKPLLSKNNNSKGKNEISLEGLMLPPSLSPLPDPRAYPRLSKENNLKRKQVSFHAPRRPKRPAKDIYDFEEDEVFEVVEEPITGKRRKIKYGEI